MFVTVVAVLCQISAHDCREIVITNSSFDSAVTFQSCLIGGQAGLAQWKGAHPVYRSDEWYIDGYKCVAGPYFARAKI